MVVVRISKENTELALWVMLIISMIVGSMMTKEIYPRVNIKNNIEVNNNVDICTCDLCMGEN